MGSQPIHTKKKARRRVDASPLKSAVFFYRPGSVVPVGQGVSGFSKRFQLGGDVDGISVKLLKFPLNLRSPLHGVHDAPNSAKIESPGAFTIRPRNFSM